MLKYIKKITQKYISYAAEYLLTSRMVLNSRVYAKKIQVTGEYFMGKRYKTVLNCCI